MEIKIMKIVTFVILVFFGVSTGFAQQNESFSVQTAGFESVEAFLKAALKSEDKLESEAKGDLNNDGLADWAGLIKRKKAPPFIDEEAGETDQTYQLYILLQTGRGGYQIAEKSKESGVFGLGANFFDELEIKNSSLYLLLRGNFCCGTSWQFKLYKGEWRLIGWRNFNVQPDESYQTDRNLLTGDVIEERQTGERKPVIKRYKKKFPRVLLKDFNLFGWNEIE
jgi:hypothetical protein